ncbi:hypothetical protein [Bifidobacterium sp. ESL0800]|uniref:leucine-rich repeat domain-containing protein n=1 Tax=Bifidobacterium sp. ESL0800 TaxID=2983236 RepID=UPI0023F9C438|nr:hypothetical protein [Bifidobacterium sp. ESL0800]WEV75781.1 hypothetical protein OZX75_00785 [Bifidobacterium sp. ESL0800]
MTNMAKIRRTLVRSVAIFFAALLGAILITAQCVTPTASAAQPVTRSGGCATGTSTIAQCFPDPVLAATVAAAGSTSGHPLTTASKFDATVASHVKQISINPDSNNLASLEGIDLLTNLRILHIPSSQLTDISPIAGLTSLIDLTINNSPNVASFTPVAGLSNLVNLSLNGDGIDSSSKPLPNLSQLSSLIYLSLDNNAIKDITPLHGLTQLMRLSMIDNNVSDISTLKNLTNLTYLYLQNDPELPASVEGNGVTDLQPIKYLPLTQFTITNQRPTGLAESTSTVTINVPKTTDGSFLAPTPGSIQPSSGSYNPTTGTVTWNNLELEYVNDVSVGFETTHFPCFADTWCNAYSGTVGRKLPFTPETFSLDPSPNTQAQDPVTTPKTPQEPERPKPTTPQKPTPKDPTPDPEPQPFDNPKTPDHKKPTLVKPKPVVVAQQPAAQPHDSLVTTGATITVVTVVAIVALALGIYLVAEKKKRDKQ